MKKIIYSAIAFLICTAVFAYQSDNNHRFEKTQIIVRNNAPYAVILSIDDAEGTWETPVLVKRHMLLPNQSYQNTLISVQKNNALENYVSLSVTEAKNPHENYLIFGEETNARRNKISSDIFDGLGPLFMHSQLNECKQTTSEGYADCELNIQS